MLVRATVVMIALAGCAARGAPAPTTPAPTTPGPTARPPLPTPRALMLTTLTTAPATTAPAATSGDAAAASAAAPDEPDPLHVFAARWPRVTAELAKRHATALVWEGKPCASFDASGEDERNAQPAIGAGAPASVSPDGRTLVVVATLALDHAGVAAIGVVGGLPEDAATGTFAIVFDGPSGTSWAHALRSFMSCNFNRHGFTWSADGRRAYVATDTGHGNRVALLDIASRRLRFEGFAGLALPSPGLEHVAWMPWFSGFPLSGNHSGAASGDLLELDDHEVWGSTDVNAAAVWDVTWTSETELSFCGRTPGQRARRFRARLAGNAVTVAGAGTDCPPDGPRWGEVD
jgi:hypothetical protein